MTCPLKIYSHLDAILFKTEVISPERIFCVPAHGGWAFRCNDDEIPQIIFVNKKAYTYIRRFNSESQQFAEYQIKPLEFTYDFLDMPSGK